MVIDRFAAGAKIADDRAGTRRSPGTRNGSRLDMKARGRAGEGRVGGGGAEE